jgi:hypothetical protein
MVDERRGAAEKAADRADESDVDAGLGPLAPAVQFWGEQEVGAR